MGNNMKTILIKDDNTIKTSELLQKIRDKMSVYSYLSDEELDKQVPPPKETTKRYFLEQQYPDTETLGMSYNDFTAKNLPVITIREYMILFLAYYEKTGKLLDKKGWTRTSTLDAGGDVVCGHSYDDRFGLSWDDRDESGSGGGPRSAMLPSTPTSLSLEQHIEAVKQAGYEVYKKM